MAHKAEVELAELRGVLTTLMRVLLLVIPALVVAAGTLIHRHYQLESEIGKLRNSLDNLAKRPYLQDTPSSRVSEILPTVAVQEKTIEISQEETPGENTVVQDVSP